jgi:uncharacterized protein (DUF2344 family)
MKSNSNPPSIFSSYILLIKKIKKADYKLSKESKLIDKTIAIEKKNHLKLMNFHFLGDYRSNFNLILTTVKKKKEFK